MSPSPPHRRVALGPHDTVVTRGGGGILYLRSPHPLGAYPRVLTDRLAHWAAVAPERVFLAQRGKDGGWRTLTYANAFEQVRRVAQALLEREVSAERPVVILSENGLEHAVLGLAALHVGVPYAPVSPPFSLVSKDFAKLRHVLGLLTPGLVFASDAQRFGEAIRQTIAPDVEIVAAEGAIGGRRVTPFGALAGTAPTEAVELAHARVAPDAVAKILFTSGSTAQPKGVVNTHRMLSCNMQMQLQALPLWGDPPPVVLDWQPWHHTAGGNATYNAIVYNGGTMYIDDGRPLPGQIEATVRNLREVAPTIHVTMPLGFETLLPYLERERPLREKFFGRLQMMFYAGAGMSKHVWDALERVAVETCGERVLIMSGLGATETAPFALAANWDARTAGLIGLPAAGVELKLVPNGEKLEARVRGPSITPGYWRQPDLTAAAFDDEGFYCMGDAVRFLVPEDPARGLLFDGRVAEDFKLTTGTWVSVGARRTQFIQAGAPCVRDAVICGHDRGYVAVLVFPNADACRSLCPDLPAGASLAEVVAHPAVRGRFQALLDELGRAGTGSSTRIARALLLDTPAMLDTGELTDKGAISQRAVLRQRAALVEELFAEPPSPRVIQAGQVSPGGKE
jgi:feruloyl-CoA synthase